MKGDFSRDTFDPRHHYTRVLMQQGRVHLDADLNEQSAISQHYLQALAADLIGPAGGPAGTAGFGISTDAAVGKNLGKRLDPGDFMIMPGRYYVNGAMCENPQVLLYSEQTGYPFDGNTTVDALAALGSYVVYLDVWERYVAAVEEPFIAEVALGGPDTAGRAQLTWQVRVLPATGEDPVNNQAFWADSLARTVPLMAARAEPPATNNDPCTIEPGARYRGLENQLYRIEVHAPGVAAVQGQGATFKWSRENGSVVMALSGVPAVDATAQTTTVQLATLGRDTDLGLVVGGWVELVDDASTLRHSASPLLRVHSIERDTFTVALEGVADPRVGTDPALHPYLRRWDHDGDPVAGGAVALAESIPGQPVWIDLEDGVQATFLANDQGVPSDYSTGDYWLVPARTATGDVQWPNDGSAAALNPQPLPPRGERHAYAGLSAVGPDPAGGPNPVHTELRKFFARLAT
ncbi:DUF6519 domain-containing protein [Arthrobacter sp. LAPM80]|uniref:DUF6519 domain-containing protein n=1 Tax=Arthrobacter sp. LAPM80 TaxID=3141788 RepID=UPI00398B302D